MKPVTIVVLSLIAVISAAPSQISENNVGNIITVGLNANVDVSNQVDVTVITLLAALLNQQLTVVNAGGGGGIVPTETDEVPMVPIHEISVPSVEHEAPQPPQLPRLTPELIAKATKYLESLKH